MKYVGNWGRLGMKFDIWSCEKKPLPEVLSFIVDNRGKTVPTSNSGHILIATNCVRNENLYPSYEKIRFLSEETYQNWFRAHPLPGDILFVCKGTPGKVCMVPDPIDFCIAQDMVALRVNEEIVNNKYLLAVLRSAKIQKQIEQTSVGDVIPHFKKSFFDQIFIPIPPMKIQEMIGDYYFAFNNKIELNKKINNNLEQQVKALFKSWFIDFEPFGGEQPPEMQFVPLQDLCKVVTKGTTPTTLGKPFTTSGINFIKAESILDNHSIDTAKFAYIDDETNTMLKRSIIEVNDIVFTIAGTLGRFALIDESVLPANTNQAVAIIRPDTNKVTASYLYSFFIGNWHNDYYSKRVQQAVQANLSLTTIKSLPIAIHSDNTMKKYDELVNPLFALMKSNEEENRKLSTLRDTLLPKLMSGELDLSEVEI